MSTISQLRKLGLFDARVPRYTSYPTANHFTPTVGPRNFEAWLGAVPAGQSVSLYVHVPFCRRLCWFCACRTQGTSTAAPLRAYLDTLKTEIGLVADALPDGVRLERLHWGGGTPTLMPADMIAELAATITGRLPFAPGYEFSVEIDPNEIDEDRLDALARAGLNRASIGVQDFDPVIQQTIGRPQTFAVTKAAADALRARGIRSLNVDILYGLPHQNEQRISESVQQVLSLAPDRVALYGYAHVPWMARRQSMIPTDALPSPEERLGLYETARQLFVWDGFREIGIDHFAREGDGLEVADREGRLRRNFQGYTDDTAAALIGVGASSISRFPQGFAQNNASTSAYQAAIRDGRFATARGHAFSDEDRLREAMIGALMCDFRIDFAKIGAEFGLTPAQVATRLNGIDDAFPGMLAHEATAIEIRAGARPLARMIARFLDAYAVNEGGHSAAI
jgi:oxygen-independent coproporphyrinogen III oxidase